MKVSPPLTLALLIAGSAVNRCHGQKCPQHSTCLDCLRDPYCASWYDGAGCYDRCIIADIPCYFASPSITSLDTPANVCARADKERADAAICAAAPKDCANCTATRLSDGNGNCAWFGRVVGKEYCGKPGCTMMGCGEADPAKCPAPAPPSPPEDNDNRVDDVDCSSYNDCNGCLSDSACGSWYQGKGCFNRCIIADIPCYKNNKSNRAFGQTTASAAHQVCARADADEADQNVCKDKSDCASCTSTSLSGGTGNCAWFGRVKGLEHCGKPGCSRMGCGETDSAKCPATIDDAANGEEEKESLMVEKNCTTLHSDCLGCLDDPDCGGWLQGGGCYANCTADDVSCYQLNGKETTTDVCARAANSDTVDEDKVDNRVGENYDHIILPAVPDGTRPEKKRKSKAKKQKGVRGGK